MAKIFILLFNWEYTKYSIKNLYDVVRSKTSYLPFFLMLCFNILGRMIFMIYVDIDITQFNHFAKDMYSDDKILIDSFKFLNDADGFQLLVSKLNSLNKDNIIVAALLIINIICYSRINRQCNKKDISTYYEILAKYLN